MTDPERLTDLEARVVELERIITEFQSGIVDWAAHYVAPVTRTGETKERPGENR